MLDKSPITSLVAARVITDLEHGRLHVVGVCRVPSSVWFKPLPQQTFDLFGVKYRYLALLSVAILHLSLARVTGITSPVALSTTVSPSSFSVRSYLEGLPCRPDVTKSIRLSAAKSRLPSLWYAPSALTCSARVPVTSAEPSILLKEVLVGCRGGFDLDVSNKVWLAVFIVGFSGIHAVSFDTWSPLVR